MKKLRQYIEKNGLRQDKFAEKVGMPVNVLSYVLNGKRKVPKKYWEKIVEETKGEISLKDLLEFSLKEENEEKSS